MNDTVIRAENLGKKYKLGVTHAGSIRELFSRFGERLGLKKEHAIPETNGESNGTDNTKKGEFWALKDVSFEVKRGEVLGIIGRNGAGKSTLLKILSQVTRPTEGRAEIRGRVGSLLEVGTGFHPELTGRENVFMNGTILGMTRAEIRARFDEIVAFAGVEKFIDTPVKRYSSGMKVRLGFAVAAHLEPEVLIVDEVLAVGDFEFQKRCLGKMQDVAAGGRTVLFVSHNMAAVENLCHRAILIEEGATADAGLPSDIIRRYHASRTNQIRTSAQWSDSGSQMVRAIVLVDDAQRPTETLPAGGVFEVRIEFDERQISPHPRIGIGIDDSMGQRMMTVHTPLVPAPSFDLSVGNVVFCRVSPFPLAPGSYSLKVAVSENGRELFVKENAINFQVADSNAFGEGREFHRGVCLAPSTWRTSQSRIRN